METTTKGPGIRPADITKQQGEKVLARYIDLAQQALWAASATTGEGRALHLKQAEEFSKCALLWGERLSQ